MNHQGVAFVFGFLMFMIMSCEMIPTVQTTWSKPGAQPGDFERDKAACEEDLGLTGLRGTASFEVCMQRKGWTLVEEPVR